MFEAASEIGATVIGETFHQFSPQGVTGVISIAESHLSIHTWPEHGYAAIDIFTCGTEIKPHKAAQKLMHALNCSERSVTEMRRGIVINSVANPKGD
jgi:S-adenosylmethionine decarboxylase